eukprot:COSAG01_NODE_19265_length_1020_cov_13.761129_3_plen_72_part_00
MGARHHRAHKLNKDGTGWHGLNPEGMEKYLNSKMTEFVTIAKLTNAQALMPELLDARAALLQTMERADYEA